MGDNGLTDRTSQSTPPAIKDWKPTDVRHLVEDLHWAWYENESSSNIDAILDEMASYSFSSFNQFIRRLGLTPAAALLAAIRRYRILYPPSKIIQDMRTALGRKTRRMEDPLLQHISTMIVLLDLEASQKDINLSKFWSIILRYEHAMLEKLDGNPYNALRLIDEVIELSSVIPVDKLDSLNGFHQLFTFEDPTKYAEFQRSLILSRIGKDAFGDKTLEEMATSLLNLPFSPKVISRKTTLKKASQVRYFFHMESLIRRHYGDNYLRDLEKKNSTAANGIKTLMKSLVQQDTNKQLAKLQAPRIESMESGKDEWYTSGWMKKHYCENIKKVLLEVKNGSHPNTPEVKGINSLSEILSEVGDLSKQNPYNQNPTDLTNLNMFQPKLIPKLIHDKYRPEDKNRLAYTMMAMNARRPGGINFANTLVDAVFIHSLRVEKIQTISRHLTKSESTRDVLQWGLRKGTGHLVDLNTDFRCEYAKDNFENFEKLDENQRKMLDFMNHYLNSYFPIQVFSYDKKKKKGFTKTMHVNRLNALGKGLTVLASSFEPASTFGPKKKETLAEKYSLNILPSTWNEKCSLLDTMMLQSLFVLSRIEELLVQLAQVKADFQRIPMSMAFRKRIKPLIEKFGYYLSIELDAVRLVTETLEDKVNLETVLRWLEDYEHEVVEYGDPGDGKKSRHPIFQRLVDEKRGIVDLIQLEDGVLKKISELQMLCSNLCPKIHSTIPKRAALEELSRKRKMFCGYIDEGEYSAANILTSNLLSARLVQQFVDQMAET